MKLSCYRFLFKRTRKTSIFSCGNQKEMILLTCIQNGSLKFVEKVCIGPKSIQFKVGFNLVQLKRVVFNALLRKTKKDNFDPCNFRNRLIGPRYS